MLPYDVLVVASLVEKESITADMPKVARVIYNRLGAGQRLKLDTTINYPLDVPSLYTSPENRAKPGPYNTYLNTGLPPTPIALRRVGRGRRRARARRRALDVLRPFATRTAPPASRTTFA